MKNLTDQHNHPSPLPISQDVLSTPCKELRANDSILSTSFIPSHHSPYLKNLALKNPNTFIKHQEVSQATSKPFFTQEYLERKRHGDNDPQSSSVSPIVLRYREQYEKQKGYLKMGKKGTAQHIIERDIHAWDRMREEEREKS